MESVPLEMNDIFEDQFGGGEDEEQMPEMLPDLPEGGLESEIQGTQNDDEAENQEVLAKLKGMKGASKNTVKRNIPKLDGTRLTGERGIPILPRVFQDVKLRGKGHEVDDLRVVMRYLEHWAHRLFPMMPFDEVLERVERLGAKRDVQTCIKKMRMDMPVLGSDTVTRGDDEDGSDAEGGNQQQEETNKNQAPSAEEMFDALLREEQDVLEEADVSSQVKVTAGSQVKVTATSSSPPSSSSSSQPFRAQETVSSGSGVGNKGLSKEILEKIERSRRLAMEKRAKKASLSVPEDTTTPNESSSQAPPDQSTVE